MDRIQLNQPGMISAYWERAGEPVDPGVVTVTIVNDAGTAIVTAGATAGDPGYTRTYDVTPAQTNQLDYWTVTWTAADGSSLTTYVEIVGSFLFSIAQARKRSPLGDPDMYPTQALLDYRTLAEMAIEDICGVAFVPRYSRHVAQIVNYGMLEVPRRRIRDVREIYTQTDTGPQALPSLTGLRIELGGIIFMPSLWNWWSTPIQVTYEHGYDFPPPRVGRAAIELCRRWVVESPWDERTTGFRTRDGGEMTILTANHTDAFDIPEVVAVADAYGLPAVR